MAKMEGQEDKDKLRAGRQRTKAIWIINNHQVLVNTVREGFVLKWMPFGCIVVVELVIQLVGFALEESAHIRHSNLVSHSFLITKNPINSTTSSTTINSNNNYSLYYILALSTLSRNCGSERGKKSPVDALQLTNADWTDNHEISTRLIRASHQRQREAEVGVPGFGSRVHLIIQKRAGNVRPSYSLCLLDLWQLTRNSVTLLTTNQKQTDSRLLIYQARNREGQRNCTVPFLSANSLQLTRLRPTRQYRLRDIQSWRDTRWRRHSVDGHEA